MSPGSRTYRLAAPNPVDACARVALKHDRVNIEQRVRSGEKNGEPVEPQAKTVQGDDGADDEVDEMTTLGGSGLRVVSGGRCAASDHTVGGVVAAQGTIVVIAL